MKKLRTKSLGQSLGSLPALVLVGALCFSMVGPALADFESAVTAYETGAYQEAQTEFEILAAAGDERAVPYLEKFRKQLIDEERTEGSLTSRACSRAYHRPSRGPRAADTDSCDFIVLVSSVAISCPPPPPGVPK